MQPIDSRDASARDDLESRLLASFWAIGRAAKNTRTGGLDQGGHWLLHILDTQGSMRLNGLATACELDASTVSRHVRQLEDRGLVTRTADPDDGRASRVEVSPEGRAVLGATRTERRALIADRLAEWSRDDLATLTELMERLAAQIDANHNRKQP